MTDESDMEIVNVSLPVLRSTLDRLKEATAEEQTKRAVMEAIKFRLNHVCKKPVKVVG